ncbi:MAG: MBL fold metallo-hydrolase [Tepidiforma sp.]|nr:MAG: MBL fold metallo-hydrolase [Tepidiforma sp.]
MELDFAFVGTGNAFAPGGLCWNGFVVDGRFLFEAPPQALQSLNRLGIDPNGLDAVVLSHHHGDHVLGLPFILLHWKYFRRERPATVVGPPGTRELMMGIGRSVYPGLFDIDYELRWVELGDGASADVAGLQLTGHRVEHDARLSLNLGYRCVLQGRSFAYTGDTGMCDAVIELASSVEVLVSECSSVDERVPIHLNLVDDIPRLRRAMAPGSRLVLTHLVPGLSVSHLDRTIAAEDLARYRL